MKKNLLSRRGEFYFLSIKQLIKYVVQIEYPKSIVVVFYDCVSAFEAIPKLNILKRDDYNTYLAGTKNDFVMIEFESIEKAEGLVFSIPPQETKLKYNIFFKSRLIRDEYGLIRGVTKQWLKGEISKEK